MITKCEPFLRYLILTFSPSRPLIWRASPFFLMSNKSSSKIKLILFYMLLQNILRKRDIARNMQKNRALFRTRFSSPTALRRFYSYTHKNHPGLSPSVFYHSSKFEFNIFISSEGVRKTTRLSENFWKMPSVIIKINKNVVNFSQYVSVLKISRISAEPFLRNPLTKILRKK